MGTYDTFLESLGPWGCSESVSRIFGHHQDDQEGQECPKTGDLEDLGYLDGFFYHCNPTYDTFLESLGLDVLVSFLDVLGSLLNVHGSLLDVLGSLLDMLGSLHDVLGSLLDVHNSHLDVHSSPLDVFDSILGVTKKRKKTYFSPKNRSKQE